MADNTGKIYTKISDAMQDIVAISKEKKNTQQNYMFRGIDDVYNDIQPILKTHRLFTVPETLEERSEERKTAKGGTLIYRILKIKYTMYADDGSCISSVVIGEGMDSGDKASNKAMAVAHKYFLMQIFCIPTADPKDPENDSHDVAPKTAPQQKPNVFTTDAIPRGVENRLCVIDLPDGSTKRLIPGPKIKKDDYDLLIGSVCVITVSNNNGQYTLLSIEEKKLAEEDLPL